MDVEESADGEPDPVAGDRADISELDGIVELRNVFTRFMMAYKFGLDELMTKINILKDEFTFIHDYSPIEHVSSRLKTPESIVHKALRKGVPLTFDEIRASIWDIAGIRITCSFISDAYKLSDMLTSQQDVTVTQVKDYIARPKPNGYKSLHLVVQIPVFMSDRVEQVPVELQIRTVAMDFWASLEHKIYYKYENEVPERLLGELKQAADVANELDVKMEHLHEEVLALGESSDEAPSRVLTEIRQIPIGDKLLATLNKRDPDPQ